MNMMNEKVMDKLRKVLRLAGDKAATQGEIEAAMAAAKKIAMEHNIELGSVDLADPKANAGGAEVHTDEDLKVKAAFERRYHSWVFHIVQEMFGVRVFVSRYKHGSRQRIHKVWIIGDATDVAMAKAIFSWLEDLYPKSYLHAVNSFQIANDAASQHGYYRGLTAGILEANQKEEDEVLNTWRAQGQGEANKYAMVLRNKEMAIEKKVAQLFPALVKKKEEEAKKDKKPPKSPKYSEHAAYLGYEKGKSINLNQVGGASAPKGQIK
jgi:hypothetical protein